MFVSLSLQDDALPASTIDITESVQDITGTMVESNTETGIAVTYDDGTGKLNFVAVDQSITNEIQTLDTFEIVSDALIASMLNDGVPFKSVDLSPYLDNTDTSGYNISFTRSNDTLYLNDGDGQLFVKLPADQIGVDTSGSNYTFTRSNDTLFIADQNGILSVKLPTDNIGLDTSGYNLDFSRSNDTLFIRDGNGILSVKLPADNIGLDTSGYNLEFIRSNDTLYLRDGDGILSVKLPESVSTDTSGYNLQVRISGDTLYIRDGDGELFVDLADYLDNTDAQTLLIDSTDIGGTIERFGITISNGNKVYIDVPQVSGSGAGQNNVGVNIGSGIGIYAGKTDTILQFKSLVEGYGIDLSNTSTEITIRADTAQLATSHDVAVVQGDIDAHELADGDLDDTNELQSLTIDSVAITGKERFLLEISDGNTVAFDVDLNTDTQDISIDSAATTGGQNFTVTLQDGGDVDFFIPTNTDNQTLILDSAIVGSVERFELEVSNGNSVFFDIPQITDTDNQSIDTFTYSSGIITLSLQDDGLPAKTIDISGVNTDNQTIDTFEIVSNVLRASLLNDGLPFSSVSLSAYLDNTDNQTLDTFEIVSNILRASNFGDGVPFKSVDLSPYLDNTDTQDLSVDSTTIGSIERFTINLVGSPSISFDVSNTTGTVTSVAATQPAAGITISGSPITGSGTLTFALANDLAGLEGQSGTGIVVRTGDGTYAQRTATVFSSVASTANLAIGNANGVSGNPLISIETDRATNKLFVQAVSTTNLDLNGTETIDGISVTNGQRVLVAGQTAQEDNGIWDVVSAGAWTRSTDANTAAKIDPGVLVNVKLGSTYGGTMWRLTTVGPYTLGTTDLVFDQVFKDENTANEGVLGVSAGASNTSVIISNTTGATGVTVTAGTALTISESTSSNGGTITLNADTTILATIHDVSLATTTEDSTFAIAGPLYTGKTLTNQVYRTGKTFLGAAPGFWEKNYNATYGYVVDSTRLSIKANSTSNNAPGLYLTNTSASFSPITWQLDSTSAPAASPVSFFSAYFPAASTAGDNTTHGWGFNTGSNGGRLIPSKAQAYIQFEENFAANTTRGDIEAHMDFFPSASGEYRPWYFTAGDSIGDNSVGSMSGNTLYFSTGPTNLNKGIWSTDQLIVQNPTTNGTSYLTVKGSGTGSSVFQMRNPTGGASLNILTLANGSDFIQISESAKNARFGGQVFSMDYPNSGNAIISSRYNSGSPNDTLNFGYYSGFGVSYTGHSNYRFTHSDGGGIYFGTHGNVISDYGVIGAVNAGDVFINTDRVSGTTSVASIGIDQTTGNVGIQKALNTIGSGGALQVLGHVSIENSGTASELRINEPSASGTNYSGFKAQAQSGNVVYTLPAASGTAGQQLTWNSGDILTWESAGGSTTNIYNSDGDIKDGGTIVDVSGNDPIILALDNATTEQNRMLRLTFDHTDDVTNTYGISFVGPNDSLEIRSYDSGMYLDYEGSGGGEGFVISSNTILDLRGDSILISTPPTRTILHHLLGIYNPMAPQTVSQIEGTANGDILVWNETGGYWEIGTSAGADGNGIYDGSDIIPDGTIATIESGGTFTFDYNGGADAIKFDDGTGYVRITDKSGSGQVQVSPGAINIQTSTQITAVVGSNTLDINEDQFRFSADTGTVRLVLFEPSASGTNYTMFTQPAMAASQTYALPVDAPGDGEVLTWNTGGTLSWETAGGGAPPDADYGDITVSSGVWNIDAGVVGNTEIGSGAGGIYKGNGTIASGAVATVTASSDFAIDFNGGNTGLLVSDVGSATSIFSKDNTQFVSADNTQVIVGSGTSKMEYIDGVMRLYDSDATQYIAIQTPATGSLTANYTLTLPVDDGTSGQYLQTNGSGALSWQTISGGGDILNGGNTTGATVVIGTNDAQSLEFETNGSTFMTANSSGNVGIGTTPGGMKLAVNSTDVTTSGTPIGAQVKLTLSPSGNSSASPRSLNMANYMDATGINLTGSTRAAWFENRAINVGDITNLYGSTHIGLIMGSDAATIGTVANVSGLESTAVTSFSNAVAGTITAARGILINNSGKNALTMTGQAGLNISALTAGTNNTAILLGTNSIPSGNYGIYSTITDASYFAGPMTTYSLTNTASVAATNTVTDRITIQTNSTGTAANAFGSGILFQGESSTTDNQDMARITTAWITATHASKEGKIGFQLGDNGGALAEIANFNVQNDAQGALSIGSSTPVLIYNDGITTQTSFTLGGTSSTLTLGGSSGTIAISSSSTSSSAIVINPNSNNVAARIAIGTTTNDFNFSSGEKSDMIFLNDYVPTSGTGLFNSLVFANQINQTGGANGITRGIYLNPTLTAVADFRAIEISANTANAKAIYQTGAATTSNFVGGIAAGTTSAPNASAQIDIVSTTKGLGMPAMTDAQRDAITSPREGLVVYTTDQDALSLRDNGIWKRLPTTRTILKTADETVNNSSTYQADDHFVFTAKANKKYVVKYYLYVEDVAFNGTNGAMKLKITAPSATTLRYGATGGAGLAAAYGDSGTDITVTDVFGSTPNEGHVIVTAYINPGASDRTVTLEWAQITADASDTKILEGSFLEYEEIN